MRIRAVVGTSANWKVVVDAFNEGYHVQGTHPQILPWTDDVNRRPKHWASIPTTAGYPMRAGYCARARVGLTEDQYDQGEILASFVAGLGGLFYDDERALDPTSPSASPDGETLSSRYQKGRRQLLQGRGDPVEEFADDQLTSYMMSISSNMVGPIYPGTAIIFRVRVVLSRRRP